MGKSIFCILLLSIFSGAVYINNSEHAYNSGMSVDKRYDSVLADEKVCNDRMINRVPYQELIYSKAMKYQVEPSLVFAMIQVESSGKSRAISRKGAKGLMQLMPATARQMNVRNPFNPEENIEGGVKYLRYLLDRFNGDVAFALAAYNAGPRKIERFGGIPPIKETQRYVKKVLSIYIQNSLHSHEIYM